MSRVWCLDWVKPRAPPPHFLAKCHLMLAYFCLVVLCIMLYLQSRWRGSSNVRFAFGGCICIQRQLTCPQERSVASRPWANSTCMEPTSSGQRALSLQRMVILHFQASHFWFCCQSPIRVFRSDFNKSLSKSALKSLILNLGIQKWFRGSVISLKVHSEFRVMRHVSAFFLWKDSKSLIRFS